VYNLSVSTIWLVKAVKGEVRTEAEGAPIVAALTLFGLVVLGLRLWWWCQQTLLMRTRHNYAKAHVADEDSGVAEGKHRTSPQEAERRLVLHACNESFDDRFDDDFDEEYDHFYDSEPRLMALTEAPADPMARAMTDEELSRIRGFGAAAEYDRCSRCSSRDPRIVEIGSRVSYRDPRMEHYDAAAAEYDRSSRCASHAPVPPSMDYYDAAATGYDRSSRCGSHAPVPPSMGYGDADQDWEAIDERSIGLRANEDPRARAYAAMAAGQRAQDSRSALSASAPAPLAPQAREETERTLRSALEYLNEGPSQEPLYQQQHPLPPAAAPHLPGRSGLYAPRMAGHEEVGGSGGWPRTAMSDAMYSAHG